MSGLRKPVMMGLVLLLCTISGESAHHHTVAPTTSSSASRDDKNLLLRRIADMVRHVDASRAGGPSSNSADKAQSSPAASSSSSSSSTSRSVVVEPRDLRNHKADRGDQIIEIFPRDLRKKEKFLKHLTGPLYFSPKCRKHVYRLYHNTRDCTIPAYFKRCARLLTRLAGSPRCIEG